MEANHPLAESGVPSYSLWDLVQYMLRLGTLGFGGPAALLGYMHRDLVERRKWNSETDYKLGLRLAQIMPGPLAAQLAIYLGYVHYRIVGAKVVGGVVEIQEASEAGPRRSRSANRTRHFSACPPVMRSGVPPPARPPRAGDRIS